MLEFFLKTYPIASYFFIAVLMAVLVVLNSTPRELADDQASKNEEDPSVFFSFVSFYREFLLFVRSAHFTKAPERSLLLLVPSAVDYQGCTQIYNDQWRTYWEWQQSYRNADSEILDAIDKINENANKRGENITELFSEQQADSGVFFDISLDPKPKSDVEADCTEPNTTSIVPNDDSLFFDNNIFDSLAEHIAHFIIRKPTKRNRNLSENEHITHPVGPSDMPVEVLKDLDADRASRNLHVYRFETVLQSLICKVKSRKSAELSKFNEESLFFADSIFESTIAQYFFQHATTKSRTKDPRYIHSYFFKNCLQEIKCTHKPLPDYQSCFSIHRKWHMSRFSPTLQMIGMKLPSNKPIQCEKPNDASLFLGNNLFVTLPETALYYLLGIPIQKPEIDHQLLHKVKLIPTLKLIHSLKYPVILADSRQELDSYTIITKVTTPITKDTVLDIIPKPLSKTFILAEKVFEKSSDMVASGISFLSSPF